MQTDDCFLFQEGSTESIYKPAYSQTLKEVLPKYQCSPALLRRKPEWGGSDPSINFVSLLSSSFTDLVDITSNKHSNRYEIAKFEDTP